RREATDAESLLWRLLRGRQLAGEKFRRQHQVGPYILDYYCPSQKIAIEADGGQHLTVEGLARDAQRTRYLQDRGIRVLRFSNREILLETEGVLDVIARAVTGEASP
ncbi:MAG: endonuclease domain-containing protein, partial [Planctomycetota bacterium]